MTAVTGHEPEKEMSLQDHLADLRKAILRSSVSVVILFGIAIFFAEPILGILKAPLMDVLSANNVPPQLHFTGPMDVVVASLKVGFLSAIVGGSPFWCFHLWQFLSPGLYPHERRMILPYSIASMILFIMGVGLCYFLILPMTLNFLIGFGTQVGTPIITINDYLSLVILLLLAFGFVFQAPIVLILLASLGFVTAASLREYRGLVVIGIFVIAAVLTPPDPISQTAMAIPLVILYEMSILVISWSYKGE